MATWPGSCIVYRSKMRNHFNRVLPAILMAIPRMRDRSRLLRRKGSGELVRRLFLAFNRGAQSDIRNGAEGRPSIFPAGIQGILRCRTEVRCPYGARRSASLRRLASGEADRGPHRPGSGRHRDLGERRRGARVSHPRGRSNPASRLSPWMGPAPSSEAYLSLATRSGH